MLHGLSFPPRAGAGLLASSLFLAAAARPAAAQAVGSPAVQNVGPPEAARFPDIAAWQDRLEEQDWIVLGQDSGTVEGWPASVTAAPYPLHDP